MMSGFNHKRGLTLIEAMIAVVVLGIAAGGVLLPFTTGAAVQAEGARRTLAAKLASDLMEQIINTPFENIVTNYDAYSEPAGQLKDAGGSVFTGSLYSNFSRNSSCVYAYVPQETGNAATEFILATVRVYYKTDEITRIKRLITR